MSGHTPWSQIKHKKDEPKEERMPHVPHEDRYNPNFSSTLTEEYLKGAWDTLLALEIDALFLVKPDVGDLEAEGYEYFEPLHEGEHFHFVPGHNPAGSIFVRWG